MIKIEKNEVIKDNIKINYKDLYEYLYSRGFTYLPNLISCKDNIIKLEYINDVKTNNRLKSNDLIKLVALLHSKTTYNKKIDKDKYEKIYNVLLNNIEYADNYYNNLFDTYLTEQHPLPSHLMFIKKYFIINYCIKYNKDNINSWYSKINNKDQERICLIHNNLRLSHYLKNINDYLISWDNYTYDSPILDLYKLFKNESNNISFDELLNTYEGIYKLQETELNLLYIITSIPYIIIFTNNEYDNCIKLNELLNYLNNSYKMINKATTT